MTHTRSLAGRTALITAGATGLGLAISQSLAAAGANVVMAVRRPEAGQDAVDGIEREGGRALAVVADATAPAQMQAAVDRAVAAFGGLDIAIHSANNPASALPQALEDVTDADWHAQASVAHLGAFNLARAAHPHLKRGGRGRFIVLASAFGLHGAGFNPVYSALKGGDRGFVKSLAREWGPDGIAVLAVAPSAATPPTQVFFDSNPSLREAYFANFPMRRMGHPREDVGVAFVALCGDHFRYITGQTLLTDGGLYTC